MNPPAAARLVALAVGLTLAGCADDPHPASGSTPGDPWHPGTASVSNDQPAPMTPPGSAGAPPLLDPPGSSRTGIHPPTTLNGYGDPTTVEESR
jgi:hypothetical protein